MTTKTTKETTMSKETLTFVIDKKKIKVDHEYADDTGRAFKDQKDGDKQIKDFIKDEVVFQNKKEGFIPYNNFESSVNWKIINN